MSDAHAPTFLEPVPKTAVVVKLPSAGVPYNENSPEGSGKLTLNAMTMIDESAILNPPKGVSFSQAVDRVLSKALQETVNVNGLLSADKFYLFMMLRAVTYGQEYAFTWECGKESEGEVCGYTNKGRVNIPGDFKVKYLLPEDKEPFEVELPVTKKKIRFRLSRGQDEMEVDRYESDIKAKQKSGLMAYDTTHIFRLAKLVTHVDDNQVTTEMMDHLVQFINSLPAEDISSLRQQIEHFTPGLDTGIKEICEQCHELTSMDLPITVSFFRPDYPVRGEPAKPQVRHDVLPGDESSGSVKHGHVGTPVVPQQAKRDEGRGDGAGTS